MEKLQDDAYAAGLKPAEFFDLTPGEVMRWLGPRWRGVIEAAYYSDGIRRRKKLPRTVAELFPKPTEILGGKELFDRARAVVKTFNKRAAARGEKPQPGMQ